MIRHSLQTAPLESNLKLASRILRLHTESLALSQRRRAIFFLNVPARVVNSFGRKRIYYQLLGIRLNLRTWSAMREVLVSALCLLLTFLFYQMYVICRVGLELADAKYQSLAIPVMQTLEALEMAERRREARKLEMESDMHFERNLVKGAPAPSSSSAK